jgi:hypothetical protein
MLGQERDRPAGDDGDDAETRHETREDVERAGEGRGFVRLQDDLGEGAVVVDDDPGGRRRGAEQRQCPFDGWVQRGRR